MWREGEREEERGVRSGKRQNRGGRAQTMVSDVDTQSEILFL